jgi:glycosyltransferase involved in cell wall biosynthesis
MRWIFEAVHAMAVIRLLVRLDPNVVVIPYFNPQSEVATFYTLVFKRKLVFRAASILDADLSLAGGTGWREFSFAAKLLHSLTLRKADAIVANASYVSRALSRTLPKKRILTIHNGQKIEPARRQEPSHVLWIGTMSRVKNPEVFLRLARDLPEIQFVMCGGGPLYSKIRNDARDLRNLRIVGQLLGQTKQVILQHSYAVINTSLAEGFPNTLIEAGVQMIPYVSFVDPDEVICRNNLGFHVNSFSELVERTAQLVSDTRLRISLGTNIRSYVEKEHDIAKTVSEYDRLLRFVLRLDPLLAHS